MKILVTSGGTREPIDGVRFISNFSSGTTGAAVANRLRTAGHDVTYLHGLGATTPTEAGRNTKFETFSDLEEALKTLLKEHLFDVVIHMAAVSDYRLQSISAEGRPLDVSDARKIPSTVSQLDLHLTRNKKLLPLLKGWSKNPSLMVIGFKLTKGADTQQRLEAVSRLFETGGVDWVVHNDLSEISKDQHRATFYGPLGPMGTASTKHDISERLLEICQSFQKGVPS